MELNVGQVVKGKVTGITKFGAFVSLPEGKSGMVHISEVANTYVSDIHDFLSEGQEVEAVVTKIDENNRINLSIKRATAKNAAPRQSEARFTPKPQATAPSSFEDKIKAFMQESESRMSDIRQRGDKYNGDRRRKR